MGVFFSSVCVYVCVFSVLSSSAHEVSENTQAHIITASCSTHSQTCLFLSDRSGSHCGSEQLEMDVADVGACCQEDRNVGESGLNM